MVNIVNVYLINPQHSTHYHQNPSIKREAPTITTTQQKSNGTTLIQLPFAKQDELLNAVLKKLRHVNLPDLQVKNHLIRIK